MAHVQESQELRRGLPSLADRPEERRGRVERHRCSVCWLFSAFRSQGELEISNLPKKSESNFSLTEAIWSLGGKTLGFDGALLWGIRNHSTSRVYTV